MHVGALLKNWSRRWRRVSGAPWEWCALRAILLAGALAASASARAQMQYVPGIWIIAGTGTASYTGDGGAATSATLKQPNAVFVDASGNVYTLDYYNCVLRKVTASTGVITTIAGTGTCGYNGDGILATAAELNDPAGVALDSSGNIYIAEWQNSRIREIAAATGLITTIAGTGTAGYSGDGGAATSAKLNGAARLAIDSSGNIYFPDQNNNRIRKITASSGIITTIAGTGTASYSGDGGAATSAAINSPNTVKLDSFGNVYISDMSNNRVRKITVSTGVITTVAGNGTAGYTGNGGAATSAELNQPTGLAIDASNNLYIGDSDNNVVRFVDASTGFISTIAGNNTAGYTGDGGAATSAELNLCQGLALDATGNLYIADTSNNVIRKVYLTTIFPATAIGSSSSAEKLLFKTTAAETLTSFTVAASMGGKQEFTVGTISGCTVNGSTQNSSGTVCSVPITFTPAYPGLRFAPLAVAAGGGNVNFGLAGTGAGPLVEIVPGTISTVAGTGTAGYTGNGGAATSAKLYSPGGVAMDQAGNLYIADSVNRVVRKVLASTGVISVYAGNGTMGYTGDGGQATSAEMEYPESLAFDSAGNLYIGDLYGYAVRKVTAATGVITTVAGNGTQGYSGDGGLATSAKLNLVIGVAVDQWGNLFISDQSNSRIRKVSASSGYITTVAGNGTAGYSGDGGLATSAELQYPSGIFVDSQGRLFIADTNNNRIRMVAANGIITTIAGNGTDGTTGNGGQATLAEIDTPSEVITDAAGNVYFTESWNGNLRFVSMSTGIISTIAGNGTEGYSGDSGPATSAEIDTPEGLAMDPAGNLYLGDHSYSVVRKVTASAATQTFSTTTPVGSADSTDDPLTATVTNIGNSALTFSVPSTGTNPSVAANFLFDSASTCPQLTTSGSVQTLAAGAVCTIAIDFDPTAGGAIGGSAVLTDNSLNTAGTTQTIPLAGTGAAVGTTTAVTSSTNPSSYGSSVTFTATVSPTSGSGVPVGTVQFSIDGSSAGSAITLSGGSGSYSVSTLAPGTHTVKAVYTTGSSNFTGSTSGSLTQTVNKVTPTVALSSSSNPSTYGTSITLTASLSSTATGTVTFLDSGTAIGTGTLASGAATLAIASLTGGAHSITASYGGDTNDNSATSAALTQTVNQASLTVALASSRSPSIYGDLITVTATFTGSGVVPTGTAILKDSGATLGTLTLSGSGVATYASSTLGAGSHALTVTYNGDTNYK